MIYTYNGKSSQLSINTDYIIAVEIDNENKGSYGLYVSTPFKVHHLFYHDQDEQFGAFALLSKAMKG